VGLEYSQQQEHETDEKKNVDRLPCVLNAEHSE
jgi:hypothetical protein